MRKSRRNRARYSQARRAASRQATGIVGVDVDDRDLEPAREPARVARAVGLAGRCRESDLVVGDDVNRAVGVVAGEPREVQRLCDNALARKRRVAVNQDRQRAWRPRTAGCPARWRPCRRRAPCRRPPGSPPRDGSGSGARVTCICPRGADVRAPGVILHVAHPAEIERAAPASRPDP